MTFDFRGDKYEITDIKTQNRKYSVLIKRREWLESKDTELFLNIQKNQKIYKGSDS